CSVSSALLLFPPINRPTISKKQFAAGLRKGSLLRLGVERRERRIPMSCISCPARRPSLTRHGAGGSLEATRSPQKQLQRLRRRVKDLSWSPKETLCSRIICSTSCALLPTAVEISSSMTIEVTETRKGDGDSRLW